MADISAVAAGVAVQGAADGAGNADERFESGQSLANGHRDGVSQLGAAAGGERLFVDLDLVEDGSGQLDHGAANAFVAHQHVRSAAQQARRRLRFVAAAHQRLQLVDGSGHGEELGRAPQAKPGEGRQRFIPLYELCKIFVQAHGPAPKFSGRQRRDHIAAADGSLQVFLNVDGSRRVHAIAAQFAYAAAKVGSRHAADHRLFAHTMDVGHQYLIRIVQSAGKLV